MRKKLYKLFIELTGNPVSSQLLQSFAESRLSAVFNRSFVKSYGVNMDEAERDLKSYKSLRSLFTRRLKDGLRPIDQIKNSVVSPVDGVLSAYGKITDTSTFPVKGQEYRLSDIFGGRDKEANYKDGCYSVFYLSPGHYHHIHCPVNGSIIDRWTMGRTSFPVNPLALKYCDKPFSTNHRIISEVQTDHGKMAIVKVGAHNVNSIRLTHATDYMEKGEEMGCFSFGSTVILLFERSSFEFAEHIHEDMDIHYGEQFGLFL